MDERERKKRRIKLILTILAIFTASLAVGTQHCAHTFKYAPELGSNFHSIYPPWRIITWYLDWGIIYQDEIGLSAGIVVVCLSVGMFAYLITMMVGSNTAGKQSDVHGNARWANLEDIKQATLLPHKDGDDHPGVYVGGYRHKGKLHYLRHNGPEHILVYAPTRSGKGVGLVNPTLLSWPESAVITDLKGELWELTAGWNKKYAKKKVIRFEPASLNSARWNVFDAIRWGTTNEEADVGNVATLIVDPDGKGLEDHWAKTSHALLIGAILHCYYKSVNESDYHASLSAVDALLANPNMDIQETWEEMRTYPHKNGATHPTVAKAAQDMIDREANEAGSVLSSLKSYLSLYRDSTIQRNTSTSDFTIDQLMNHTDPVMLYIITKPADKNRLKPLVRLIITMIVRILADVLEARDGRMYGVYKHRLLLMLDEFPSLGKLDIMQESLAFIAGYGLKAYLITQDLSQLYAAYGGKDKESITSNCHVQIAYPPNRLDTAKYLSEMTGQTTKVKENISTSGKRISIMHNSVNRSFQEVQAPLKTPDQILRLPGPVKNEKGEIVKPGQMLIFTAGFPAILGEQLLYFKEPIFNKRSRIPAPMQSDVLIQQTTKNYDQVKYEETGQG